MSNLNYEYEGSQKRSSAVEDKTTVSKKKPRGLEHVRSPPDAVQRKLINTLWISLERVRFQNRAQSLFSVVIGTAPAVIEKERDSSTFVCIHIRGASDDLKRKESDDESGEYSPVRSDWSMRWVRLSGEDSLALIARAKTLQRATGTGLERFSEREIDRCSLGRRTFVFYRASPPIERSSAPLQAECSTLPEGRGG